MNAPEEAAAQLWLRHAGEDLATAQRLLIEGWAPARHVCFLAQQAEEKSLKAALQEPTIY